MPRLSRNHSPRALALLPCCVCVIVGFVFLSAACREERSVAVTPAGQVRPVRVLLFDAAGGMQVRVDGPVTIVGDSGEDLLSSQSLDWTPIRGDDGLTLGDTLLDEFAIEIVPGKYGTLHVAEGLGSAAAPSRQYAGSLRIEVRDGGGLRVVNLVDIESYIAGVVPGEVWPSFHDETLKVQAIAARTYALYLMSRHADRPYDLRGGEGDQVYRGIVLRELGDRARDAVNATRGLVLGHDTDDGPRIFCTFYSAACGGMSQSIADVQESDAPPPLRGEVKCDYCKIAEGNAYRWGPTEITKATLFDQLARRFEKPRSWSGIEAVEVTRRNPAGRIAEVMVTGSSDESMTLRGEVFRLTVGSRLMRSTACTLTDEGSEIQFTDGRGFGHGVGLCQWGAEGQARAGRYAGQILQYYFPGSRLVRAY